MNLVLKQGHKAQTEEALFVIFSLSGEEFAAPVAQVREVIKWRTMIKIPESDVFIEGVINIRGRVIPVVNLKKRLRFAEGGYNESSRVMIVDVAGQTAGLIVDQVREVARVDMRTIQQPPQMTCGISNDYIQGVIFQGERMVIMLDLDRIFGGETSEALLRLGEGKSVEA